ncbi:MAG: glycosyltransferase family 4 protein [Nitrososphaerota archaeon]
MRVLLISDGPNITTGYGNIAYYLAKYLLRIRGVEVVFGSLQQLGSPLHIRVDSEYLPVYSVYGCQPAYYERTLSEVRPDVVVHIRDPVVLTPKYFPSSYRLKPLAEKYGAKVIHWAPFMGDPPADVVKALSEDSDLVLVPTNWAYDLLLYAGFPSNRMAVLRWGIDDEIFHRSRLRDRKEARRRLGLSEDAFVIGTIGVHDRPHKNYPAILRAASVLNDPNLEVYLHTSSGSFDIQTFVERYGLKGKVVLPATYIKDWGWKVEDYLDVFAAIDVYVTASGAEGFNIPAVEAVCCGVATVASDIPVHREVLGEMATFARAYQIYPEGTYFCYVVDPEDLAEKIRAAKPPDGAAVEEYRRRMSWMEIAKEFKVIVSEVIGR